MVGFCERLPSHPTTPTQLLVGQLTFALSPWLRHCSLGASRLSYLLRCSPCFDHPALGTLYGLMRSGLEAIVNCFLNDHQWLQAMLPIRDGGLGIRRVK